MANISLMSGGYQHQKGLTLVEILVALTLGLVVTAMVLQIFLSSRQVYLTQEQSSGIQENGNFALEWFSKYIRLAGYRDDPTSEKASSLRNLSINACGQQGITFAPSQVIVGLDNVANNNNSDCIIFRYRGNSDNSITDCHGTPISNNTQIVNVFFLVFDQDINDWVLRCDSAKLDEISGTIVWDRQPFIDNVQDLQILYETIINNAANTRAYLTAAQIGNNTNLWNNVVSVKIALLLRSENNASITNQNQTYVFPPWSNQPVTANDFRFRRVFTTTIDLRN